MKLKYSIASASGLGRKNVMDTLTDEMIAIIARIAQSPSCVHNVNDTHIADLIAMEILRIEDKGYKVNTAIFFEEDLMQLHQMIMRFSERMADALLSSAEELNSTSANVRNFIGSIMGMGQGLHQALKGLGLASQWQTKTGKFEKSRVDFYEYCAAHALFGRDLQNKNVVFGKQYTAVTIGYDLHNHYSYLKNCADETTDDRQRDFLDHIATGLTDIFPMILRNVNISNDSLIQAMRCLTIDADDASSVITREDAIKYQPIIDKISNACYHCYMDHLDVITNALRNTTSGRNGAPIENMSMSFWRLMRGCIAQKLYDIRFLTDNIPSQGSYMIFYENDIGYF